MSAQKTAEFVAECYVVTGQVNRLTQTLKNVNLATFGLLNRNVPALAYLARKITSR